MYSLEKSDYNVKVSVDKDINSIGLPVKLKIQKRIEMNEIKAYNINANKTRFLTKTPIIAHY